MKNGYWEFTDDLAVPALAQPVGAAWPEATLTWRLWTQTITTMPADSLKGFKRNFCAQAAVRLPEADDAPRPAMTQPNVYWTLLTPMVTIIGLYTNVQEGVMHWKPTSLLGSRSELAAAAVTQLAADSLPSPSDFVGLRPSSRESVFDVDNRGGLQRSGPGPRTDPDGACTRLPAIQLRKINGART